MSCDKKNMNCLSYKEKELAAIGAAVASNCIPCLEYHIPAARKAGLSDAQIRAAVELAEKVRRVPVEKVLQTAFALLEREEPEKAGGGRETCGCN
jgi:AhpD family alkylhydroperoxidase